MNPRARPEVMADLARLLGRYSAAELRAGLDALADPESVAALRALLERAEPARPTRPRPPRADTEKKDEVAEAIERVARLKAGRPADSGLIDEVLSTATRRWTQTNRERVAEITEREGVGAINGRDAKRRLAQLVVFVEHASRRGLEELAGEFRAETSSSGSLGAWSDIILGDRRGR